MHIAQVFQNLWLKAEGTLLSSDNHYADFSVGIQDMVLLSYLNLLSYLIGNKHVIIQEIRFKKYNSIRANEQTILTHKTD